MAAAMMPMVLALWLRAAPPAEALAPYAKAGQGATGEVVKEENGELELDTTPCEKNRTVLTFKMPYTKEAAGSVNCRGADRQLVQAVQK